MKTLKLLVLVINLLVLSLKADAQFNIFPATGRTGIGTGIIPVDGPQDLLHIRGVEWTTTDLNYQHPALRISLTPQEGLEHFGQLAIENNEHYSALSQKYDFVLRASPSAGDLYLADGNSAASIRMTTTPNLATDLPIPGGDIERLTISHNGNVAIDIPPTGGYCTPLDQVQIGGGNTPISIINYYADLHPSVGVDTGHILKDGISSSVIFPGLTLYGGNRMEGTGPFTVDYRYLAFNSFSDHIAGSTHGTRKIVSGLASSSIGFAGSAGGLVNITANRRPEVDNFAEEMVLSVTGRNGIEAWSDESWSGSGVNHERYHHLFECWRPGYGGLGWGGSLNVKNNAGLFYHHTPVYIGGQENPDITSSTFPVQPSLMNYPWMLVVNGPGLAKEFFVETDWPDFVFEKSYRLAPLGEVEAFLAQNKHLPNIPSASEIAKTGVPLGATEAKLLQKIEELTLYVIQSDKTIQELRSRLDAIEGKSTGK